MNTIFFFFGLTVLVFAVIYVFFVMPTRKELKGRMFKDRGFNKSRIDAMEWGEMYPYDNYK